MLVNRIQIIHLILIIIITILLVTMKFINNRNEYNNHNYHRKLIKQIVKGSGKAIYLVEDGILHHIPDWDTFIAYGFDLHNVQYISDQELASYPVGEPLDAAYEEMTAHKKTSCPCDTTSIPDDATSILNTTNTPSLLTKRTTCIVDNDNAKIFFKKYENVNLNINIKMIEETYADKVITNSSRSSPQESVPNPKTTLKDNITSECNVLIKLIKQDDSQHQNSNNISVAQVVSRHCPSLCYPIPILEIPIQSLAIPFENPKVQLTCTLNLDMMLNHSIHLKNYPQLITKERPISEEVEGKMIGMLLRSISQRLTEECHEAGYWPSGTVWMNSNEQDHEFNQHRFHSSESHVDNSSSNYLKESHFEKRQVYGLIIWVGSVSRIDLIRSQIQVMFAQSKEDFESEEGVVGWLATEHQYPCRFASTVCSAVTANLAYFNYMPTTQMNVASVGWGCAQRRVLRALAHVLHLFEPKFILTVDDDTWVNYQMLIKGGIMYDWIRNSLVTYNIVMGALTMGKKVTRHGFYYGGAGYLWGEKVIKKLTSNILVGPSQKKDEYRDEITMIYLSLIRETIANSQKACPDCIEIVGNATSDNIFNEKIKAAVRVIDLCNNMMSDEHTCYHSDHALSRCLVHGVYADPMNIGCGGSLISTNPTNIVIGMCFGTDNCDSNVHLTCHRWEPNITNPTEPIPYVYINNDVNVNINIDQSIQ